MSLQFSDTTNNRGIVQLIDETVKSNSTTYPLISKVRDVNLALDRVHALIFQSEGTWQYDDSNQTDYPIISTNLVSGQRDYSFVADANGNLILQVYKVMIADSTGLYREIDPVDVQGESNTDTFYDGQNLTGIPTRYDKTANGIFLDLIPNYNYTNGLKVYVNREASYFTTSDTTKKPGFAGLFHEYPALFSSLRYAKRNGLDVAKYLGDEVENMEKAIKTYYGAREKDVRKVLSPRITNYL